LDVHARPAWQVGILIGESQSVRQVARRFGVRIEPLASLPPRAAATAARPDGVIWEAASWADIRGCLEL
jgi:hypothetical protein